MNKNAPTEPSIYPALSGEVWDSTTGFDQGTTDIGRPPVAKADPVTENPQPTIFSSGDPD